MLSFHEMKRLLNPQIETPPSDDFRILDSWTEFEGTGSVREKKLKYLCFEISAMDPETGKKYKLYKAIKFARVERLPKSAKQSTSFMDMQSQVLSGVYSEGYNFITVIANMIRPVPEGLMFLYGVQGVAEDIDTAKEIADLDFNGFIGSIMGTFRTLHLRTATAEEGTWLEEKMRTMTCMTAVRGIPKANTSGENAGNKGIGGQTLNPDAEGTLEEIIAAMSDYEYVIEVLATPVYTKTLMSWQSQTQKQMTEWYGQLQGQKSLSMNLSIPMTYMTSLGSSQGWSKNYTDSHNVSYTEGESYNTGYSENVGESLSQSIGESFGISKGQSQTDTTGYTQSISQGVTEGVTRGHTVGTTHGQTLGYTHGVSVGENEGMSLSMGEGSNFGTSNTVNRGVSLGESLGESTSHSTGSGTSQGYSTSESDSYSVSQSQGQSFSNSYNTSHGESSNLSHSLGNSISHGYGSSESAGVGGSQTHTEGNSTSSNMGGSISHNEGNSWNTGNSSNQGWNKGQSNNESDGWSVGGQVGAFGSSVSGSKNHSNSTGSSWGTSGGSGLSSSEGGSSGNSFGINFGSGSSHSTSDSSGSSWNSSHSTSESHSVGQNESYSTGQGTSYSEGYGTSYGNNQSLSYSNGHTSGTGTSVSNTQNVSDSYGTTKGTSYGQTAGNSQGTSSGNSYNISLSKTLGRSVSSSMSESASESISESVSDSLSKSVSQSNTQSIGQNRSRAIGQSSSESYTQSISNGTGKSWGSSESVSKGKSYGESEGTSKGTSLGNTGAVTMGSSGAMGIGPSIGYSKSYQWLDQEVKDILELLEYQNERYKKALRGNGAFYTYVYIACDSMDALATAQAAAKATWQNEYAMVQPLQVLELSDEEQQHLLYHFTAFSADVNRENIAGISDYKYATVLLPNEFVAYSHLPRVSGGGIDTAIDDIPQFRLPGLLRGEIYMGTQIRTEYYTYKNGYKSQFDYRIKIDELMHGVFTGQSRSGKTVAAMRFIRELANARRTSTGKRLRIVIMDPKQDWRGIARFVEPERFRFYSMGNPHFRPINLNPCKIPYAVEPQHWIDGIVNIYCRAYGLMERGKQMLSDVFYKLYEEAGVFREEDAEKPETWHKDPLTGKMPLNWDWKREVSWRSAVVTFHKIYKEIEYRKESLTAGNKRAGNDTLDAFSRLTERLSCFNREFSIEYRLFSKEDDFKALNSVGLGYGVDELIGEDDITVFESYGLESTFANFIFGILTSGFYKYAKSFERGYLNPAQYETVLVIEEANKVLTGSDTAGTGGQGMPSLSGQSEFEEILDQSAGYGLFIIAITQKISMMPSSIVANCGLLFAGKLSQPEDVNLAVRMIGREERIDDRDVVKWFPKSPTGWFICRSNRGYDFRDAEPVLVAIEPLNNATISNAELNEILLKKEVKQAISA